MPAQGQQTLGTDSSPSMPSWGGMILCVPPDLDARIKKQEKKTAENKAGLGCARYYRFIIKATLTQRLEERCYQLSKS